MDIYSKPGSKVMVTKESRLNSVHKDEIDAFLKIGKPYTVNKIEVHDWVSYVWLKELPGQSFNSVNFINV